MSPADAARLELAKRAYQATQPTELELQTGVRRARLALLRPKQRRKWFLKGLVFVVLALGGLAYAKPHAIGELVERGLSIRHAEKRAMSHGAVNDAPVVRAPSEPGTASPRAVAVAPGARVGDPEPSAGFDSAPVSAPTSEPPPDAARRSVALRRAKARANVPSSMTPPPETSDSAALHGEEAVSDWGRVGQALAQGDEDGALAALGKLAKSDDVSTRDKADLGRAQLMMASGQKERACELARSLVHRRPVGHVQRQALLLLEDCSR